MDIGEVEDFNHICPLLFVSILITNGSMSQAYQFPASIGERSPTFLPIALLGCV
ncbi:hypothetical protein OGM63_26675 [Plectonema radiosum NIES-515]|uniref:Uncharacterized protein n=1 Tax=Plectonema radiosum NIES-515 TaxID=2986073 RepID=A0ABT3B6M8_9CYAN|nr:hypothetical protein [Plectonema radiosum]MCV3217049.1 hypothetical protein [Plectonema radiosum NIES-515]